MSTLAQRLRTLRLAHGLTLAAVAERAKVGVGQLSAYENAHQAPRLATLARLAEALGVSPSSLLKDVAMSTPSASGYMSLDQAAVELQSTQLAVQRLIARGRLAAVQLGTGGPWRIAASALAGYIGQGAPDLACPETLGSWFDTDDGKIAIVANGFAQAVINACARQDGPNKQLPPDSDPPKPKDDQAYIPLTVTPAVAYECDRPAPSPWPERAGKPVDVRTVYIARALRIAAQAASRGQVRAGLPSLARLYESPQAYRAVVAAIIPKVLADAITFTKGYVVPLEGWKFFRFGLPVKSIATGPAMTLAESLAF